MILAVNGLDVEVREGTVDDVPTLLSFIRAMATFEKLTASATEDVLRESLLRPLTGGKDALGIRRWPAHRLHRLFLFVFDVRGQAWPVARGPVHQSGISWQGHRGRPHGPSGAHRARRRAAVDSSGRCSTGTKPPSGSTKGSVQRFSTSGGCAGSAKKVWPGWPRGCRSRDPGRPGGGRHKHPPAPVTPATKSAPSS